jgi:hypothetical protein
MIKMVKSRFSLLLGSILVLSRRVVVGSRVVSGASELEVLVGLVGTVSSRIVAVVISVRRTEAFWPGSVFIFIY